MKFIGICIAAAAMAPVLAWAVPPGQYDVGGIQQICLVADGTWYGTTYADWGGAYQAHGARTFIFGNWDGGAGNDAMNFGIDHEGHWTEWTDDLTTQDVLLHLKFTHVKSDCDPPPARTEGQGRRPQQK